MTRVTRRVGFLEVMVGMGFVTLIHPTKKSRAKQTPARQVYFQAKNAAISISLGEVDLFVGFPAGIEANAFTLRFGIIAQ